MELRAGSEEIRSVCEIFPRIAGWLHKYAKVKGIKKKSSQ
jgi:hypothetical protein